MNKAAMILVIVMLVGGYQAWVQREVTHAPGILVANPPLQKDVPPGMKSIPFKGTVLDPLAEFSLQARVLSTQRYWFDKLAPLISEDVALGWGVMSDTDVLKNLKIWQEDRFYLYSWRQTPGIDAVAMNNSSANMHLIPSTEFIAEEIKKLRKGQLIRLSGYLVRINFADGSEAKSSLSRDDSGAGACEIVWVQSLEVL